MKIFIIDDDIKVLEAISHILYFEGHTLATATSAEEALDRLPYFKPDIIILDIAMAGIGGLGLLKEISDEHGKPQYPVIVLTARSKLKSFFSDLEVTAFIEQPCSIQELLEAVEKASKNINPTKNSLLSMILILPLILKRKWRIEVL